MMRLDRMAQIGVAVAAAALFTGAIYLWATRGNAIVLDLANFFCL